VLILDPTVIGGVQNPAAVQAIALGLTLVVVTAATWATMSAADFASYPRVIVLGNPNCYSYSSTTPLTPA
jgi:hypothetical protein